MVRVKVLEIDPVRRRIALTMRLSDDIASAAPAVRNEPSRKPQAKREPAPQVGGAMAAAMAKLRKGEDNQAIMNRCLWGGFVIQAFDRDSGQQSQMCHLQTIK